MKRKKKYIIIVLLVIGLIAYLTINANVFDSIYYSRIKGVSRLLSTVSLWRLPQLEVQDYYDLEPYFKAEGLYEERYAEEYLKDIISLTIGVIEDSRTLIIQYSCKDGENTEVYTYEYDVSKKELSLEVLYFEGEEIFGEEIKVINEERKNYLYTIFLKDWFEANKYRTRFSLKHLGRFDYVEH